MKLENVIYCGDNLEWMRQMPDEFVDLVYADPPFFSNKHYEVIWNDGAEIRSFEDRWKGGIHHYIEWMKDRCFEIHRILKPTGTLYLHCDWHASHYLKVMLDEVFGQGMFRNEVVWSYDYGGRSKRMWPRKHDVLLFYTESNHWTFNHDALPRIPYKGKMHLYRGDVEAKKAGKTPTDVWDIPIINTRARERLGYPTQKPIELLTRIVRASSNPDDLIFDPFCGCGTTLVAAQNENRKWLGVDVSPTACKLMQRRLRQECDAGVEIVGLPLSIKEMHDLEPFEFQNWIIGAMGGTPSKRKVRDMGIDGYTFFDRQPIQVKQSEHVGRPVVDDFETALRRYYENATKAAQERGDDSFAMKGIVVAFSFTRGAYEEVARAKGMGVEIELLEAKAIVKEFGE